MLFFTICAFKCNSLHYTPAGAGAGGASTTILFTSTAAFGGVRGNRLAGVRSLDDGASWLEMPDADLPGNLRSVVGLYKLNSVYPWLESA